MTSPRASLICKSFTKPHETISVPKSGSIICDKAFSTSFSAVPVDTAETPAKDKEEKETCRK